MSMLNDLRVDIGDDGSPLRFTDAQLITIIEKATRRINRRLNLSSTVNEITVVTSGELSPDTNNTRDLVLLQAECMLLNRDFVTDLNSGLAGVYVMDGEQSVDNRNRGTVRGSLLNSQYGPCAELEQALLIEEMKRNFNSGKLIW